MATKEEVLEYVRRNGKYMKFNSRDGRILSGIGIRRLDVVRFFRKRGHCDITTLIKKMIINHFLYYRVFDGDEYIILPTNLLRWLEKKGVDKFTDLVNWKKLGREPVGDL